MSDSERSRVCESESSDIRGEREIDWEGRKTRAPRRSETSLVMT